MKITAAITPSEGAPFEIRDDIELNDPGPDEVIVRTVGSGICHTDMLVRDQRIPTPLPAILGHEGSGVVEVVGSAVQDIEVGDHVVATPPYCGQCSNCLRAELPNCDHMVPLAFSGRRGDGTTAYADGSGEPLSGHFFGQSSFGSRMLANARDLVRIPSDLPLELMGPLGCSGQTGVGTVVNSLRPEAGSTLAVIGTGSVGLFAVMAAQAVGVTTIIAVDLLPHRLELARELGATHAILAGKSPEEEIKRITGGGADYTIDAVGEPETLGQAVRSLRIGGTAAEIGANELGSDVAFPIEELYGRTVLGVMEGDSVPRLFIPVLLNLYRAGKLPIEKLIKQYALDEINKAMDDSEQGKTVKPVLVY